MSKSTFALAFYCRPSKASKKTGLAPIELSLCVNGKRSFINLPQKLDPAAFTKAMGGKRNNDIKAFCATYSTKVNEIVRDLTIAGKDITIDNIKNALMGNVETASYSFNQMWVDFLKNLAKKVDVDIELSTYCKYQKAKEYSLKTIDGTTPIDNITLADIEDMYASMRKTCSQNTANKYSTMVKSAFRFAINNNKTTNYPFANFKMKTEVKEITLFSEEEYNKIKNTPMAYPHLENVKNIFIFLCNSGLSYGDLKQLKKEEIQNINGTYLICKPRLKTNVMFYSAVLQDGIDVFDKISIISNQKFNTYLNVIEQSLNISVHLHAHLCRHYYASHLLRSGIPIEIVSKCLGHSKITMTQHYAKLLKENVAESIASAFSK